MKRADQVGVRWNSVVWWLALAFFLGFVPARNASAQVQCWTPTVETDEAGSAKWAGLRKAMLAAAEIGKRDVSYMAPPELVRMRMALHAGPYAESGARMHLDAYPEKTSIGIELWKGKCEVIRQVDDLGASIGNVAVFFNYDVRDDFLKYSDVPKLTGTVGGYPEFNNWIVVTKNGRLPWIPKTLNDKLNELEEERLRYLKTWEEQKAARKVQDPALVQKNYEMFKKTDPKGAANYLKSMRDLEQQIQKAKAGEPPIDAEFKKQMDDLKAYRTSFSAAQLASPAIWTDPTESGKKAMEAQVKALSDLTPEEQKQIDEWGRDGRSIERQAQVETKNKNTEEAARLRAQANELYNKGRELRKAHQERVQPQIDDLRAQYALRNLKPGDKEHAMGFKPDPAFPDRSKPNQIQVITVGFWFKAEEKKVTPRGNWRDKTKQDFDFVALAKLLD
jgi:hypothetical protein